MKACTCTSDSLPSDIVQTKTNEPIPGVPTSFRFSSYRTANMIKLRWNEPNRNHRFVNCYGIEYRTRWGKDWAQAGSTPKLSYRVNELSQDKKYYFRIRAINRTGDCSEYTNEIDVTTKFSKISKAALSPLVFAGSTVAAPFLTGPLVGVAAGMVSSARRSKSESEENKKEVSTAEEKKWPTAGDVVVGASVGIGAGVVSTLCAPITAPLTGGLMVAHFASDWGEELSDQSDLDEKEFEKWGKKLIKKLKLNKK